MAAVPVDLVVDLVDSAAELFFMPRTVRLGHGGEAHVGWSEPPRIDKVEVIAAKLVS